ncbi:serine acetyltransferase [Granulosicoccaceae sp. 1_MG-2023]|nr:serine acetyltransferase [Granulosicoccaceae sp. 1_MG-2023]
MPSTDAQAPRFFDQIREDWSANGRDWLALGFRALLVHRIGERAQRARGPLRFILWRIYWFGHRHCRNRGIEIPPSVRIGRGVGIFHQGAIVFHPAVVIGDGCRIRHGVTLGAGSTRRSRTAPTLGNHVDIGVGAVILGDITVGERSRIGANVVLTESVPPDSVVVMPSPTVLVKPAGGGPRVPLHEAGD